MSRGDLSEALWYATASPAPETERLDGSRAVPVAIIGGGYTGLSTALHLAQKGIEAAVFEADEIGFGGSGRNGGHLTPTFHFRPEFSLTNLKKRLGEEKAGRLIALQTGAADLVFSLVDRYGIACDLVKAGCIHAAHTPSMMKVLEEKNADYAALGRPMRLLDRAETAALTGSDKFHGAWVYDNAGNLQPLSYARGLAGAALQEGAQIYTKTPVTSLRRVGGKWALGTPRGTVTADTTIIATGAYGSSLWPRLKMTYAPFALGCAASVPVDDDIRRTVLPQGNHLIDTRRDTFALMIDAQGRLVTAFNSPSWRPLSRRKMAEIASRRYGWVWPQVAHLKWEYFWSGTIDLRPDLFPRLFELDKGLVTAIGFSGRGIPTGTALGTVLADWVSGVTRDQLAAPIERPSYVPPLMRLVARMMVPSFRRHDARLMRADGLTPPRF
jgi:glycine/D-amino acid oxidase-like deaminating enzyme